MKSRAKHVISTFKVFTVNVGRAGNFRNEDVFTRKERFWAISLEKFPEDFKFYNVVTRYYTCSLKISEIELIDTIVRFIHRKSERSYHVSHNSH